MDRARNSAEKKKRPGLSDVANVATLVGASGKESRKGNHAESAPEVGGCSKDVLRFDPSKGRPNRRVVRVESRKVLTDSADHIRATMSWLKSASKAIYQLKGGRDSSLAVLGRALYSYI